MRRKRSLTLTLTALVVVGFVVLSSALKNTAINLFAPQTAIAQTVSVNDAWQQVYQQLPDLPREDQYVSRQTGKVDPNNTLVRRLISYHVYTKGRPPNFRLDWKLTLADYLGANEIIEESRYPGSDTLRQNPLAGDRAAIERLSRQQRDALVQSLVNVLGGGTSTSTPTATPVQPQPPSGGAEQLRL